MPKIALDCFYIIAVFESNHSILMAQVMEAKRRDAHLFDDPFEAAVHCAVRQNSALRVGEDKVGFLPIRRCGLHKKLLLLLVLEQTNDGR